MYVSFQTLRKATQLVEGLANADFTASTPEFMLPALADLVGCDVVTYNEIDPAAGRVRYSDYPAGWIDPGLAPAFVQHVHEHPLVNHMSGTGDLGPVKMSDIVGRQRLHQLGLYSEFFRPIRIEHQIGFSLLPSPDGQVVGIAINRGRGDFTEDDRALLAVIMEPLSRAMQRASQGRRARAAVEAATGTAAGDLADLSDREVQVLELAARGRTNIAIARSLGVSPRTVAKHLEHAYRKLGVTSRAAAVYHTAPGFQPQSAS